MPYCTKCGEKIIDGNVFCIKCGEKIHIPKTVAQRNATDDTFKVENDTHTSDIPVFVSPSEEIPVDNSHNPTQQSGSVFMPPTVNSPGVDDTGINNSNTEEKQINSPPVFTPPSAPKFTPPAQTFTPPAQTHNGPVVIITKMNPLLQNARDVESFFVKIALIPMVYRAVIMQDKLFATIVLNNLLLIM